MVASRGTVNNTTVKSGGRLNLIDQAAANGIELASGGTLSLASAASATGLVAENGAALHLDLSSDTYLSGTSGGKEIVIADGAANDLTIESGGSILIRSGITATDTIVKQGGQLNVLNLGSAVNVVEDGGYVTVAPGAGVNFVEHEFSDIVLQDSAAAHGNADWRAAREEPGRKKHPGDQRRQHNHEDAKSFTDVNHDVFFFFLIRQDGGIVLFGIPVLIAHSKLAVLLRFHSGNFIIPRPRKKTSGKCR